jgi:hypothetical protein
MSAPIKMYGPYANITDAAKAGFKIVKGKPDWSQIEYAFWVILKPIPGKPPTYCFTEPETIDERTMVTLKSPPGLKDNIRAFCHTHPIQQTTDRGFGHPDKVNFQDSRKLLPTLAWYLLNPFGDIRYANNEDDFPMGREIKW